MEDRTRLHDAIVGGLITLGILLDSVSFAIGYFLIFVVGIALLQQYWTGICPVYKAMDLWEAREAKEAKEAK